MKVIALFATVNAGVLAFTPNASPRLSTKLEARRDEGKRNNFVGGALAFVAGIATAGQVAFADPAILMDNTIPAETQNIITQSSLTVSIGAPSFGGGSSFETLDFSLPSYSESTGGASDGAVKKNEPPSFKADFPELKLPSEEKKADDGKAEADAKAKAEADAKKEAEDKAAAKKAAEEEKAAKAKAAEEARIQKEKEAAEKAEKEEKRKAEIAARKEAEKKKQEEMVARQKAADEKAAAEKKAAEEKAAAEAEKPKVEEKKEVPPPPPPAAPKAPEIKAPEVAIPAFTAPKIEAPKVDIPKFEAPKFEVPAAPKAVYDLDIKPSSLPDIKAPSVPSFGGSTSDEPKAPLEPQEVRDEKARQAKDKFKKLDEELKEIEKKAAAARELAKEAKKEAKDAKDLACETRPGGKILCLRSPGIGY